MNAAADTGRELNVVPLPNAVFCVDCETISNSPHDACTICGSHSLISLFRMLGGTLRPPKAHSDGEPSNPIKYNLELTAKVHEIPASELNLLIGSITRLAQVSGEVESLHLNVETVFDTQSLLRAA